MKRGHVPMLWLGFVGLLLSSGRLAALESPVNTSPRRIWITNDYSVAVIHIPGIPHRFSIWQKLNPIWWFGNADEPVPPAWYRPGQRSRTFLWHLRNPFHNFDCYVIGLSDKQYTRTGRYPEETFNPYGGWNWGACRYHCFPFPYLSYGRGHIRAYAGWRPGGAFGLELRRSSDTIPPQVKPAPNPPPIRQKKNESTPTDKTHESVPLPDRN